MGTNGFVGVLRDLPLQDDVVDIIANDLKKFIGRYDSTTEDAELLQNRYILGAITKDQVSTANEDHMVLEFNDAEIHDAIYILVHTLTTIPSIEIEYQAKRVKLNKTLMLNMFDDLMQSLTESTRMIYSNPESGEEVGK